MRSPSFLDLEIWLKPSESVPDRGREKERETESMYVYYANIRQFRGKYFIGKFTYILSMFSRSKFRSITFIIYN